MEQHPHIPSPALKKKIGSFVKLMHPKSGIDEDFMYAAMQLIIFNVHRSFVEEQNSDEAFDKATAMTKEFFIKEIDLFCH